MASEVPGVRIELTTSASKNPTTFECEGGCGKARHSCRCKLTRFCRNCDHFRPGGRASLEDYCQAPELNPISPVTGERTLRSAVAMRQDTVGELRCGTIGRFYTEKSAPPKQETVDSMFIALVKALLGR